MADWGIYNPATFVTFPESDLTVNPETRHHFALALYGIPEAFAALKQKEHFWAMSIPMRLVFGMMPTRYPHFYSGQGTVQTAITPAPTATAPIMAMLTATAPTVSTSFVAAPAAAIAPVSIPPAPSTPGIRIAQSGKASSSRGSKMKRGNTTPVEPGPSVNNNSPLNFEAASTSAPVTTASNKKSRVHFLQTYGALKGSRVRSLSVDTLGDPPSEVSVEISSPKQKPKNRKIVTRNARKRASSVFVPTQTFPDNGNISAKLREEVGKAGTWQAAFKVALRGIFSLEELKTHTAKFIDQTRLKMATDLVREFCQRRGQSEPTNAQFHTTFSYVRRH